MNEKLNKLSIFANIVLVIFAGMQAINTPLFTYFFEATVDQTLVTDRFKQTCRGQPAYVTTVKYRHVGGRLPAEGMSIALRVRNSGSEINDFDLNFHDTMSKDYIIKREKGSKYVRLEVARMRPEDELDITICTTEAPDIEPTVRFEKGRIATGDRDPVHSTAFWVIVLIVASFGALVYFCRKIVRTVEKELDRVIGERNELQNRILDGHRKSTDKRGKE